MQIANVSSLKVSIVALVLAMFAGFGVAVQGQQAAGITVGKTRVTGLPEDWSHRHVVIPDPGSAEDAIQKGTYDKWTRIVNDPRYVLQQLKLGLPARGPAAQDVAFRNSQAAAFAKAHGKPSTPPGQAKKDSTKRDWSVSLGSGGVAQGMYPAKYSFDVDAEPSCTADYAAFPINVSTGATRAHVVGTFASGHFSTGTFVSLTVTPTGGSAVTLTLTPSTTLNTGLNFLVYTTGSPSTDATDQATNLAAAIDRNLNALGIDEVGAVSSGATVTVYTLTAGSGVVLTDSTDVVGLTFGTVTAGANGTQQANIVGFNELYSGTTGVPLCKGLTNPEFIFSYASGVGPIATSPALSMDGTKIAYVENDPNIGAILHVLTFASGSTEYGSACASSNNGTTAPTCATAAVVPGVTAGSTANDFMLPLGAAGNAPSTTGIDSYSSVFVNYSDDTAYVGDNGGFLYSISGIFLGQPAHSGGNFPVTVNAGFDLSSPVVDIAGTGDIIVGDSDGDLHNYTSTGTAAGAALLVGAGTANTTGGGVRDSPIVDSTNSVGYAVRACNGTNSVLMQFGFTTTTLTSLRSETLDAEGCSGPAPMYSPTPTNSYYDGGINSGALDVCYAHSSYMALNQYQFTAGTMNATAQFAANQFLAHGGAFECSPLAEFYSSDVGYAVTGVTQVGTTVTVTTATNLFVNGQVVTITGVTSGSGCSSVLANAINGEQTIAGSTGTSFTFTSLQSGTILSGCGLGTATATGATQDYLFFGVNYTTPEAYTFTLPLTSATQLPLATETTSVAGGTSAMAVDNDSASGQAASIYFGTLATSNECGTGTYCAVKLTQSGLQ